MAESVALMFRCPYPTESEDRPGFGSHGRCNYERTWKTTGDVFEVPGLDGKISTYVRVSEKGSCPSCGGPGELASALPAKLRKAEATVLLS